MVVCVRAGEEIPGVSGRVRESSLPMLSECSSSAKKMFKKNVYIVLTDRMYVHHQQKMYIVLTDCMFMFVLLCTIRFRTCSCLYCSVPFVFGHVHVGIALSVWFRLGEKLALDKVG